MTTEEVANRLVSLCREGKNMEAIKELYHEDIESIDPEGVPSGNAKGVEAVMQKEEGFFGHVEEVHSAFVSDPLVSGNYFSVNMGGDYSFKDGNRNEMNELCIYKVDNGKIVYEQFFFDMMG